MKDKIMITAMASVLLGSVAQAQRLPAAFVQRVRQALASAQSTAYRPVVLAQLGDEISFIMQQCFPQGTPADTTQFILIGNVLPNRTLADVEVQPRTRMTQCFEERFARLSFPQLPAGVGQKGIALYIPMQIGP